MICDYLKVQSLYMQIQMIATPTQIGISTYAPIMGNS